MWSSVSNSVLDGVGRDNRTCVNLEIRRLFIIIILPKGVRYLAFHRLINYFISIIFFSMFKSAI